MCALDSPAAGGALRRGLVACEFGLAQFELLADRSGDAGTCAQPLVIGPNSRPFRQFDRRSCHRPVDDRDEIAIGDAEMVEQEFPVPAFAGTTKDL